VGRIVTAATLGGQNLTVTAAAGPKKNEKQHEPDCRILHVAL
jgi:hypothetical protein